MPPARMKLTRECIENNSIPEPNSGCWIWLTAVDHFGYGRLRREQITHKAHVASYSLFKGPVGNLLVLHKCHNPSCVNPDHLKLGNDLNNARDKVKAGRSRSLKFLAAHKAKRLLSDEELIELRSYRTQGKQIADILGVSRQTIQRYL